MNQYLVFRISAALGSMGDQAGHQRRGSETWPARSSLLGLIGAALGIDRSDENGQELLDSGYGVGVAMRRCGPQLIDFHTAQSVPTATIKRPDSRKIALDAGGRADSLNTILSQREYRQGVTADVIVSATKGAQWSLDSIAEALRKPHYTLFFGRKSCPLDRPCAPLVLKAPGVLEALEQFITKDDAAARAVDFSTSEHTLSSSTAYLDPDLLPEQRTGSRLIRRRDRITSRERWLFRERDVLVVPIPAMVAI